MACVRSVEMRACVPKVIASNSSRLIPQSAKKFVEAVRPWPVCCSWEGGKENIVSGQEWIRGHRSRSSSSSRSRFFGFARSRSRIFAKMSSVYGGARSPSSSVGHAKLMELAGQKPDGNSGAVSLPTPTPPRPSLLLGRDSSRPSLTPSLVRAVLRWHGNAFQAPRWRAGAGASARAVTHHDPDGLPTTIQPEPFRKHHPIQFIQALRLLEKTVQSGFGSPRDGAPVRDFIACSWAWGLQPFSRSITAVDFGLFQLAVASTKRLDRLLDV